MYKTPSLPRLIVVTALYVSSLWAEQQPRPTPVGSVTGHVVCSDNYKPAKFAPVLLFGIPTYDPSIPPKIAQTQTDGEGNFTAISIVPGDYYIFASVPGYIQPKNLVQAIYKPGETLDTPLSGIPLVHVAADRVARVNVTVERGAAVSGTILWDDGSPVTRATITVVGSKGKSQSLPPQFAVLGVSSGLGGGGSISSSDDLGHFRISGLVAGEYLLRASLQTHSQVAVQGGALNLKASGADSPVIVFGPSTFHSFEAKPLVLHTGEDRDHEQLTLNLSATHSVSGQVVSSEDRHGINSATVTLQDTQDKLFSRSATVDAGGNFCVAFVPSGTYEMTVTSAGDTEPSKSKTPGLLTFVSEHNLRSYEDARQSVVVVGADVAGKTFTLAPLKATRKDFDMNELIKR